jgi:hypothetical protein
MKTSRLSDHDAYAPFRFKIGDQVAIRRPDGTPDPDSEKQGVIVDGTCEYQEGGGSYSDIYEIQRADGLFFRAKSVEIVKRP